MKHTSILKEDSQLFETNNLANETPQLKLIDLKLSDSFKTQPSVQSLQTCSLSTHQLFELNTFEKKIMSIHKINPLTSAELSAVDHD